MKPVNDLQEYIGKEDELVRQCGLQVKMLIEKPSSHGFFVIYENYSYDEVDNTGISIKTGDRLIGLKEKPKVQKTFWRRKWYIDSSGMLDREHEFAPTKEKFDERSKYAAGTWSDEWESITIEVEEGDG